MFVALDLPEPERSQLAEWRDALMEGRRELRPVRAEALHMTLVFVVRDEHAQIPDDARWLGADETAYLADVAAVLGEVADGYVPAGRPPWRDRAWLGSAEKWMIASLAALDRPVRGPVEQSSRGRTVLCATSDH